MKKYEPKKLVSISRYQDYFPTLSTDIKEDVYRRIDQLILEQKQQHLIQR